MGPVLQVDGAHAHRRARYVQLRQNGQPPANPPLAVKVPVVLLRQADRLGPFDGPAGEDGVAVETLGVLSVHQLDELQAERRVHPQPLRQLQSGVLSAGADAAVVQLIGQNHIEGPDRRAGFQKIPQLLQAHAPLHIEHQHPQGLRGPRRERSQIVHLRLGKLGNLPHDLRLGGFFQQRPQALPLLVGQSLHRDSPPSASLADRTAGRSVPKFRLFIFVL